jgi:integrase
LRHAERRGLVSRNAAALAVMPKTPPPKARRSLTPEEGLNLLAAARGERLEALVAVGLMLGLRPGELTGLLWSDLDLDGGPPTLTVSGSMKHHPDASLVRGAVKRSSAGLRTVELPPALATHLREHKARQAAERLALGPGWEDHGLVFPSDRGTPLDPANLRKAFKKIATKAGLEEGFPYALRHTAVSLLIDAGLGVEAVADLVGDDPRTLYKHYRHRVRPVADAAAGPMQALFGGK